MRESQTAYERTEKGVAAKRRYRQSEKGRSAARRNDSAYLALHQDRKRARKAVADAVDHGRLAKVPCHCGSLAVQGHHHKGYDGTNALDVIWLCARHHREAHA